MKLYSKHIAFGVFSYLFFLFYALKFTTVKIAVIGNIALIKEKINSLNYPKT